MPLNIVDVRDKMPNYEIYKDWQRAGVIFGIAIHHSATVDRTTGAPLGDAYSYFDYHVNGRGWSHGGYNYIITGDGTIQYALAEKIAAYHAGFKDPGDTYNLEQGQFWNNHYLAICLAGWFNDNRTYQDTAGVHAIPNNYTYPGQAQVDSLLALIAHLREKYQIIIDNVRGHRELLGNSTQCPGLNLDPAQIRARLSEVMPPPSPDPQPQPGEHVVLVSDTADYLNAALSYIWKFQPDVSFAPQSGLGKWRYITAVGNIRADLLAEYRRQGALVVDHFNGAVDVILTQLDELIGQNRRFRPTSSEPEPDQLREYTVQSGDTLSKIAKQFYGNSNLWPVIFESNRDTLPDPGRLRVGQKLRIPPKP